ncbi:MAG: hypothetical protein IPK07_34775 [Deltaproteobacteria bacterium]|nr:hypothetical protein [Deltaproteobacteria bacterium]
MEKTNGKKTTPEQRAAQEESPLGVAIEGGARLASGVITTGASLARDGREATSSIATATLDWLDATQRAGLRASRQVVERVDRLADDVITWVERLALSGVHLTRDTTQGVAEVASRATLTLVRPSDEPTVRAA